jgi:hypothetical protein
MLKKKHTMKAEPGTFKIKTMMVVFLQTLRQ